MLNLFYWQIIYVIYISNVFSFSFIQELFRVLSIFLQQVMIESKNDNCDRIFISKLPNLFFPSLLTSPPLLKGSIWQTLRNYQNWVTKMFLKHALGKKQHEGYSII